jgi:hypothetical protein
MNLLLLVPHQTTLLCQEHSQTHGIRSKVLENTGTTNPALPFSSTLYLIWVDVNDVHDNTNVQPEERNDMLVTVANSIMNALDTL